jgi:hypothetical protein
MRLEIDDLRGLIREELERCVGGKARETDLAEVGTPTTDKKRGKVKGRTLS